MHYLISCNTVFIHWLVWLRSRLIFLVFFAFKHSPRTSWTVIKMQYQRFVCQFYWFYLPVIKSHSTFLCWPVLLIVPLFDIHIRSSNLRVFQIYWINAFMLFADCHSFGDQTNRHKRLTSQKPDLRSKAIAFYWIMNFIDVYIAFYNRLIL